MLEEDFKKLGKCDLYICACRTKGNTLNYLEKITKDGTLIYNTKWSVLPRNISLSNVKEYIEKINNIQVEEIIKQSMDLLM